MKPHPLITYGSFEWEELKAQKNFAKHEVRFEEASTVFDDPLFIIFKDPDHSIREQRYIILGQSERRRYLIVSFTERERERASSVRGSWIQEKERRMSKRRNHSEDTLRPHYDLNELEVVALGPGWAKRASRRTLPGANATQRFYASNLAYAGSLFSSSRIDRDLLIDFFMMFARAEYALKKSGYLSEQRTPKIRWEKFALKIGDRLVTSSEPAIQQAIRYLTENPPAKQVVIEKSLTWEPLIVDPERPDATFLIRSITTVRNNLFHGGKKIRGPLAERDFRLLLSCLNLLSYALTLDRSVLRFFQEEPAEAEVA